MCGSLQPLTGAAVEQMLKNWALLEERLQGGWVAKHGRANLRGNCFQRFLPAI
jgi:hypothetical protein